MNMIMEEPCNYCNLTHILIVYAGKKYTADHQHLYSYTIENCNYV